MTAPAPSPARRERRARPQAVLAVRGTRRLGRCTVRVVAGGPGFAEFRDNEFTDKYAKLHFVDPALGLVPPYDLDALRESLPPEQRPVTRTYSIRRVEPELQQLTVDFVVHGPHGLAAPWAAAAQPGDLLSLSGAGGGYAPDPLDGFHLFAGDEAALPAVSSALEALPADARGVALLETQEDAPELDTAPPAGVEVVWLSRPHPGETPRLLADAIAELDWPAGRVGVFAHGERESMKAIRGVLRERDLHGGQLSLSGYWAHGRTEDVFQAEKRTPVGTV